MTQLFVARDRRRWYQYCRCLMKSPVDCLNVALYSMWCLLLSVCLLCTEQTIYVRIVWQPVIITDLITTTSTTRNPGSMKSHVWPSRDWWCEYSLWSQVMPCRHLCTLNPVNLLLVTSNTDWRSLLDSADCSDESSSCILNHLRLMHSWITDAIGHGVLQ